MLNQLAWICFCFVFCFFKASQVLLLMMVRLGNQWCVSLFLKMAIYALSLLQTLHLKLHAGDTKTRCVPALRRSLSELQGSRLWWWAPHWPCNFNLPELQAGSHLPTSRKATFVWMATSTSSAWLNAPPHSSLCKPAPPVSTPTSLNRPTSLPITQRRNLKSYSTTLSQAASAQPAPPTVPTPGQAHAPLGKPHAAPGSGLWCSWVRPMLPQVRPMLPRGQAHAAPQDHCNSHLTHPPTSELAL